MQPIVRGDLGADQSGVHGLLIAAYDKIIDAVFDNGAFIRLPWKLPDVVGFVLGKRLRRVGMNRSMRSASSQNLSSRE